MRSVFYLLWAAALAPAFAFADTAVEEAETVSITVPSAPAQVKKESTVTHLELAPYFPSTSVRARYSHPDGTLYADYGYHRGHENFQALYDKNMNLNKPGFLGVWEKKYAGRNAPATYAQIFFGNDQSVTEVGDWLNRDEGNTTGGKFLIFGYVNTSDKKISGLGWSPVGGFDKSGDEWSTTTNTVYSYFQNGQGGEFKFKDSDTKTNAYVFVKVEHLDSFTPAYGAKNGTWGKGNGKTYNNVVRLLFYHGPTAQKEIDCSAVPGNKLKELYSHAPGYGTYLSEYYLAEGKWIIQERTVYIEDGSFWKLGTCTGAAFVVDGDDSVGATYLDEREAGLMY